MNKSHLLLNANILGLNTAVLCVVEYDVGFYPCNIYEVARYDEDNDLLITNFDTFKNLNRESYISDDSFDRFLEVESWMEKLNYQNNKASRVEICGSEISNHLKEKHNTVVDSLEVEHRELLKFINECFHKEYILESKYRKEAKTSIFAQLALDKLLENREEEIIA